MKDLSPAKKILGVELVRNRKKETIFLTQEKYVQKVLDKFRIAKSKPVQTPLATHFKFLCHHCPKTINEESEMNTIPYSSVVGCLIYAIILTRPDIYYAVSLVSRFMANPGKEYWKAVVWILRYFTSTTNYVFYCMVKKLKTIQELLAMWILIM